MKVYAPEDLSYVTALGVPAAKGEEFDVEADIGAALIEQGWTSARAKAAKRTGRKRKAQAAAEEPESEEAETSEPEAEIDAPDEAPTEEHSE